MSIQSFVLRRCTSASLSGFPANSGLKCNQFNGGTWPGCAGSIASFAGDAEDTLGCAGVQGVVVVLVVLHQPLFFISYVKTIQLN